MFHRPRPSSIRTRAGTRTGGRTAIARAAVWALLHTALAVLPANAAAQGGPVDGLADYMEAAREDWEIPGMAVGIFKDGRVEMLRGFGVRELGGAEPVDEHTLFANASTTKAFTTAIIAMLVDEGRLSLDDRVIEHLPWFRMHDPYVTAELTVRDIITHRSGLSAADDLWYASDRTPEEIARRLRHQEPFASLRSRYAYNNNMYMLAGEVVEAVTGTPWAELVDGRILQPLGMTRTLTGIAGLEARENHAKPHVEVDGVLRPVAHRDFDNIGPAGSMNSSVAEMVRWLAFNLDSALVAGRRLISDSSHAELFTPQTLIPSSSYYPAAGMAGANFTAYGLGWFLQDYAGRKVAMHTGSIDGMSTLLALVPEEGLGLIVFINRGGGELRHALMYRIIDAYLGLEPRDWSAELRAHYRAIGARRAERRAEREAGRVEGTAPTHPLAAYAGTYAHDMYDEAVVSDAGGRLTITVGPLMTGELEHWHHDTFRSGWSDPVLGRGFVTFRLDADGRVQGLELEGIGDFTRERG